MCESEAAIATPVYFSAPRSHRAPKAPRAISTPIAAGTYVATRGRAIGFICLIGGIGVIRSQHSPLSLHLGYDIAIPYAHIPSDHPCPSPPTTPGNDTSG